MRQTEFRCRLGNDFWTKALVDARCPGLMVLIEFCEEWGGNWVELDPVYHKPGWLSEAELEINRSWSFLMKPRKAGQLFKLRLQLPGFKFWLHFDPF